MFFVYEKGAAINLRYLMFPGHCYAEIVLGGCLLN